MHAAQQDSFMGVEEMGGAGNVGSKKEGKRGEDKSKV